MTRPQILRGSRGKVSVEFSLHLSSVNSAIFAFNIIFALWALYQTFRCLRILHQLQTQRIPYTILLFAILFTLADDIMSAVEVALDYNTNQVYTSPLQEIFYYMWNWVYIQADILLAVALLVHIIYRMSSFRRETSVNPSNPNYRSNFPSVKLLGKISLDVLLVFTWTCLMIAVLAITSVIFTRETTTGFASVGDSLFKARENLPYARLAFHIVTTLDITISSLVLWVRMKMARYYDKSITFIAFIASPALLIRCFYLMAINIIATEPLWENVDYEALNLATLIIENLAIYTAIYMLMAGADLPPRQQKEVAYH